MARAVFNPNEIGVRVEGGQLPLIVAVRYKATVARFVFEGGDLVVFRALGVRGFGSGIGFWGLGGFRLLRGYV